jgi:hypothetical protein
MSALNNQTNRNVGRYFFATSEDGEQTLGLQFGTTGGVPNLSTMAVTISGSQGNGVVVSQAPQYAASEFMLADQALITGTASSYFTLSTLTTTAVGTNIGIERVAPNAITCIENYCGNSAIGGFDFLVRGVNSQLVSTILDPYFAASGSPGTVAQLTQTGTFRAGGTIIGTNLVSAGPPSASFTTMRVMDLDVSGGGLSQRWVWNKTDIGTGSNTGTNLNLGAYDDGGVLLANVMEFNRETAKVSTINQYAYPQSLQSTIGVANQVGTALTSNTPTSIFTQTNSNMLPSTVYLADVKFQLEAGLGGGNSSLELGVRLGGNGDISYGNFLFFPPAGTNNQFISQNICVMTEAGNTNQDIEVIAYLTGTATLSVSTNTSASLTTYLKQVT